MAGIMHDLLCIGIYKYDSTKPTEDVSLCTIFISWEISHWKRIIALLLKGQPDERKPDWLMLQLLKSKLTFNLITIDAWFR